MVCPEDAWTGLAPHNAAKDDFIRMRSGLSPAVTSNAEAVLAYSGVKWDDEDSRVDV